MPECKKQALRTPLEAQVALRATQRRHREQGRTKIEQVYYYHDPDKGGCGMYHLSAWPVPHQRNGYAGDGNGYDGRYVDKQ